MNTSSIPKPTVLVVEDEPDLLTLYELTLLREGFQVETADTVARGRHQLAKRTFDVVLTDMRLPDGNGLDLLRELTAAKRPERCVVMTAYGSAENAVDALKAGAFDYLTKPVELKQFRRVVHSALGNAAESSPVPAPAPAPPPDEQKSNRSLTPKQEAQSEHDHNALDQLIGHSAAMRAVRERIRAVAGTMAPVLIQGESGTGKELAAHALHDCSHRAKGPFVPVNCGAIPENLLEAEFFGARKGAYTGATQDRKGFFQAASGGTLFLDEIGELPVSMQAKLLRAIQERCVRPLGTTTEELVDVRIVSATHKDLAAEVQSGHFRSDLFYRLNVIGIALPPLRDRREDIPALCTALLARLAPRIGVEAPQITPAQLDQIKKAPLPGNVRELENLLQRALALGEQADLNRGDLSGNATSSSSVTVAIEPPSKIDDDAAADNTPAAMPGRTLAAWLDAQERELLTQSLAASDFQSDVAAAQLGLTPRQLHWRLQRLNVLRAPVAGATPT